MLSTLMPVQGVVPDKALQAFRALFAVTTSRAKLAWRFSARAFSLDLLHVPFDVSFAVVLPAEVFKTSLPSAKVSSRGFPTLFGRFVDFAGEAAFFRAATGGALVV